MSFEKENLLNNLEVDNNEYLTNNSMEFEESNEATFTSATVLSLLAGVFALVCMSLLWILYVKERK